MNKKQVLRKRRSRSGSAVSNSESELTLGASTPIPSTDSMSEHSLTSVRSKHHGSHKPYAPSAEKGAIGDGEYQLKQDYSAPFGEDSAESDYVSNEPSLGSSNSKEWLDFSDPVFRKISRINGEINRMHKYQLRQKLEDLYLHTGGIKKVLKRRLKNYYRHKKLTAACISKCVEDTQYDFLVIIDFEATCQENNHNFVHEIIEFPAVLVDAKQKQIVGMFREFCKPVLNPVLTEFCKQLTGANQSEVDNARVFPEVLKHFERWLEDRQLGTSHSFCVVTDGPWDLMSFLSKQCEISKVPFPWWGRNWINVRKTYGNFYGTQRLDLQQMLVCLGLVFEGRPHCGLDDSKNIAHIVIHLLEDGCPLKENERYDGEKRTNAHFMRRQWRRSSKRDVETDGKDVMTKDSGIQTIAKAQPVESTSGERKPQSELSEADSNEDLTDLMFYFKLQST